MLYWELIINLKINSIILILIVCKCYYTTLRTIDRVPQRTTANTVIFSQV